MHAKHIEPISAVVSAMMDVDVVSSVLVVRSGEVVVAFAKKNQ